jgi:hypothetical protein
VGLVLQSDVNEEQRAINSDQRRAIDDQIRANDEDRVDESMEYAIRVSWWRNPAGDNVTIQNRSTVPIRDVTLRFKGVFADDPTFDWENIPIHDSSPVVIVGLIPPCTSYTIDGGILYDRYTGSPPDYGMYGLVSMFWVRVDFVDVHGSWSVGEAGQHPQVLEPEDRIVFAEGDWPISGDLITEESASDCGSG